VPSFVVDATILAPGIVDAETAERKLLVLAALGRLNHYVHFGREELTNPSAPQGEQGGVSVDALIHDDIRRAAILDERLPRGTRRDFYLILSLPILDDFEELLRHGGVGRGLAMSAELAARARRTALTLAVEAPTFLRSAVPQRTGSSVADTLLETAARAGAAAAEFVVSDAPQVASRCYERFQVGRSELSETVLLDFARFVENVVNDGYDLDEIDGRLLEYAAPLLR
jgi:hypothetical protein